MEQNQELEARDLAPKRRSPPWILVLGCALALGAAAVVVLPLGGWFGSKAPGSLAPVHEAAASYLEAVEQEEYRAAYEMATAAIQDAVDFEEYKEPLRLVVERLGSCRLKQEYLTKPGVTLGGTTSATVHYLAEYERDPALLMFDLEREGGEWRIGSFQCDSPAFRGPPAVERERVERSEIIGRWLSVPTPVAPVGDGAEQTPPIEAPVADSEEERIEIEFSEDGTVLLHASRAGSQLGTGRGQWISGGSRLLGLFGTQSFVHEFEGDLMVNRAVDPARIYRKVQ